MGTLGPLLMCNKIVTGCSLAIYWVFRWPQEVEEYFLLVFSLKLGIPNHFATLYFYANLLTASIQ